LVITGKAGNYEIMRALGSNSRLNYHACRNEADEWQVLAIASTVEQNAVVDRTGYLLGRLAKSSEECEKGFAEQTHSGRRVHYDWLFPRVVDTFVLHEQGERRVNILSFPEANLKKAFALEQLIEKKQRVDLKTSAWIMGRLLKLLGFLHESNVQTPILISNFLLEPENHRLLMLNWTDATIGDVPTPAQQCFVIKQAAECVLLLLGAEYSDGAWHYDYELEGDEERYIQCLKAFHKGDYNDAFQAHAAFYDTVESLWGRKYHPFTIYAVKTD